MILINEITESQFRLYDFKFVIGDYATYNSYFKIVLETSEIIGLQTVTGGIKPSAEIFNNKLILIAGNNFYIYDLDGKIIRQFTSDCIFYEFIIYKNNILVVSELSIFLLNYDFVKILTNPLSEAYNEYTIETATELAFDPPELTKWQSYWRSGWGKGLATALFVMATIATIAASIAFPILLLKSGRGMQFLSGYLRLRLV